jgi:hypothetical protein
MEKKDITVQVSGTPHKQTSINVNEEQETIETLFKIFAGHLTGFVEESSFDSEEPGKFVKAVGALLRMKETVSSLCKAVDDVANRMCLAVPKIAGQKRPGLTYETAKQDSLTDEQMTAMVNAGVLTSAQASCVQTDSTRLTIKENITLSHFERCLGKSSETKNAWESRPPVLRVTVPRDEPDMQE